MRFGLLSWLPKVVTGEQQNLLQEEVRSGIEEVRVSRLVGQLEPWQSGKIHCRERSLVKLLAD